MTEEPTPQSALEAFLMRVSDGTAEPEAEFLAAHSNHRELLARRLELLRRSGGLAAVGPAVEDGSLPESFDDFRTVSVLGRGGSGIVFRATQLSLGRDVAVKILRPLQRLDPRARERFAREVAVLARLRHPNVVRVFGSGEVDGAPYLVMELVEGEPLAARLRGRSVVTDRSEIEELVGLVIRVADALQHLHDRGVVHRDVKPQNILLDERGEPLLVDLGLARDVAGDALTLSGDVVGTLHYTAPEQALGRVADGRADVFGLGATLYHLLCGRPPIEARTPTEYAHCIERDALRPSRGWNPVLPADLATVLDHALELTAERRYPTVRAFADDLQAAVEGRAIGVRRAGLVRRGLRWMRRRPAVAALVLVTLLAAVLGGIQLAGHLEDRARAADESFRRRLTEASQRARAEPGEGAEELRALCRERPGDLDAWFHWIASALGGPRGSMERSQEIGASYAEARRRLREVPAFVAEDPACDLLGRYGAGVDLEEESTQWRTRLADDPQAMARLADALSLLGRQDFAVQLLESVAAARPGDFETAFAYARLTRMSASPMGLRAAWTAHLLRPSDPGPLEVLGIHEAELGRHMVDALRALQSVEAADATSTNRWRAAIEPWTQLRDRGVERVRVAYQASENPFVGINLARVLQEVKPPGWIEESIRLNEAAAHLSPVPRYNLANCLYDTRSKDSRRIAELYESVLGSYGHLALPHSRLATLRHELGEYQKAWDTIRVAVERFPDDLAIAVKAANMAAGPEVAVGPDHRRQLLEAAMARLRAAASSPGTTRWALTDLAPAAAALEVRDAERLLDLAGELLGEEVLPEALQELAARVGREP